MRFFFEIAYKGSAYHGWQKQKNALTVQEVVEKTLSTFFKAEIVVIGSGRTDTGVHCEQQFFHADINREFEIEKLIFKLNSFLPQDISILGIKKVHNNAHARFDAICRSYEYRISRIKNPFLTSTSYHFLQELDVQEMNKAAAKLLLHTDFKSFSKIKTATNTFNCDIIKAEWILQNDLLIFYVSANRFLRGMVRALTGSLLDVGMGRASVEDFEAIIAHKDRTKAGRSAPAKGLFLTKVEYPENIFIH